jgi:outer membrane protein insertion porin family
VISFLSAFRNMQNHRGVCLRFCGIAAHGLIATILIAFCTSPASAQTPNSDQVGAGAQLPNIDALTQYQDLVIREIKFENISKNSDRTNLLQLLPLKIGERLDRGKVRETMRILFATRRFADIQITAESSADGVSLSIETAPNYFIGEVTVEGEPNRPTSGQIANASKLQLGELFSQEKVDSGLKSIKQLLDENGFYRATVTIQQLKHEETQQIGIAFHIRPGAQAHVGQVTVTGIKLFSHDEIEDITKMHSGDTLSAQRVSTALDRLRKKYQKQNRWLAQATISRRAYRPESNAVDFDFKIDPGPTVAIAAEGFRIRRSVLKQSVPVYEENALDDDLLNEGRRNLSNYLQARGYFEAKVSYTKHSDAAGRELRIVYDIDPGPIHKLAKVEIVGNMSKDRGLPEDMLRAHMQTTAAGRVLSHGRYSQALLNDDIKTLDILYRANGFQNVRISSSVVDDYQGKKNVLAVFVKIDVGPQTIVGALHLLGNEAKLAEPFPVLNTDVGQPFSDSKIADDREIILNYYFNQGFPNATFEASANPFPGQPDRMDVTFSINEGKQLFVDQVLVSGLYYTRPFVVQRELLIEPGTALSQNNMLQTEQRLYDLGIFGQVETAVQNPGGVEPSKTVLVDVREARRYTFTYGGGLQFQTGQPTVNSQTPLGKSGVSPLVSLQVTRLNFRGRDHTITFSSRVGRLQQRGLIGYEAPRWFNSPDWKLSITGFYDDTLDVTTFTSQRLEGSIQAEQKLGRGTTMDYRFTYRLVKASNVAISQNLIPLLSLPVRVGEPGFTYVRDKRDNAFESMKGSYITIDGGVAASYFGSESDFSRILGQHSTYHAFGKNRPGAKRFVLARSIRLGLENPFSNTIDVAPGQTAPAGAKLIPLAERFFSGGGNSHRGFGLNQAGPRDPQTGFPLGGSALFLNNLELRLPPMNLPYLEDNVSLAIFDDAGNVFTDGNSMLHSLIRWRQKNPGLCGQESTASLCDYNYISNAIGVGIRYKTPIGPVRFDLGYNMNPPAFPSFKFLAGSSTSTFVPQHAGHFNVYFSIGQSF